MQLSLIVAVARNGVIGRDGRLPWHLSTDLRRFKKLTMGHTLIMGRRTFESIGRPLPGRTSIVLSRNPGQSGGDVRHAGSFAEACALAADDSEAFVIGGADIFRVALPHVERIYLTRVQADVPGDVVFPDFDATDWQVLHEESHPASPQDNYPHTFQILARCGPA